MMECKDVEGVQISKNLIALFTCFIVLLTTVSSAVAYTVGVKTAVEEVSKDVQEIKEEVSEIHPRVNQNSQDIAVIKEHYRNIDLNIQEIKKTLTE